MSRFLLKLYGCIISGEKMLKSFQTNYNDCLIVCIRTALKIKIKGPFDKIFLVWSKLQAKYVRNTWNIRLRVFSALIWLKIMISNSYMNVFYMACQEIKANLETSFFSIFFSQIVFWKLKRYVHTLRYVKTFAKSTCLLISAHHFEV